MSDWCLDTCPTHYTRNRYACQQKVLSLQQEACLPQGVSLEYCEECGDRIPEARREALPGVRLCVHCQEEADREQQAVSLYNRKGSKDSQLR